MRLITWALENPIPASGLFTLMGAVVLLGSWVAHLVEEGRRRTTEDQDVPAAGDWVSYGPGTVQPWSEDPDMFYRDPNGWQ